MFIFAEPPYFLSRPEDTIAVAGADVTLDCQVIKKIECLTVIFNNLQK